MWLADSFRGLPPPNPDKYPADTGMHFEHVTELAVPLDTVQANFEAYGLLDDGVRFVEGLYRLSRKNRCGRAL